jgi:hypothetical protein
MPQTACLPPCVELADHFLVVGLVIALEATGEAVVFHGPEPFEQEPGKLEVLDDSAEGKDPNHLVGASDDLEESKDGPCEKAAAMSCEMQVR